VGDAFGSQLCAAVVVTCRGSHRGHAHDLTHHGPVVAVGVEGHNQATAAFKRLPVCASIRCTRLDSNPASLE
jgi:hypothetical protein